MGKLSKMWFGRIGCSALVMVLGASVAHANSVWIAGHDMYLSETPTAPSTAVNPVVPQWSYGYEATLGTGFTLYTTHTPASGLVGDPNLQGWQQGPAAAQGVPDATVNVSALPDVPAFSPLTDLPVLSQEMFVHPGGAAENPAFPYTVIRWTAPSAGKYLVSAYWRLINGNGDGVDVHLLENGSSGPYNGTVSTIGSPATTLQTFLLTSGSTLDFVVGPGASGNNNSDHTAFNATITAVPSPQAWSGGLALVLGLGALKFRRVLGMRS